MWMPFTTRLTLLLLVREKVILVMHELVPCGLDREANVVVPGIFACLDFLRVRHILLRQLIGKLDRKARLMFVQKERIYYMDEIYF